MQGWGCVAFCITDGSGSAEGFDWITLLMVPVVVFVAQQLVTGIVHARQRYRRQFVLVENLLGDVERTRVHNAEVLGQFSKALKDGIFRRRVLADRRYYIFMASGASNSPVFRPDTEDFFFLSKGSSDAIISYYDTQSLVYASMDSFKTDAFRDLKPDRKLSAIEATVKAMEDADAAADRCSKALTSERNIMLTGSLRMLLAANSR